MRIRESIPGDRWLILSDLREEEELELQALGHSCDDCMRLGLAYSRAYTMFVGDEPMGMFGVMEFGDHNVLWGVFTKAIERHPITFLRASLRFMDDLTHEVVNYVDARNVKAVKWFRWMGFEVSDPVPYGINGELFHAFRTRRQLSEAA
jgi:hypothetical protein